MTPSVGDRRVVRYPAKADGETAIPPVPTMGSKLTKSQIDKLKNLSREFAAIAKEGKETPATSATLAEHTEHHSEAAKVAPAGRSGKAGRPKPPRSRLDSRT